MLQNLGFEANRPTRVESRRLPFEKDSLDFHHLPMRNDRALCTYRYTTCKSEKRDRNTVDTFQKY
jgi:hypothetical protein